MIEIRKNPEKRDIGERRHLKCVATTTKVVKTTNKQKITKTKSLHVTFFC